MSRAPSILDYEFAVAKRIAAALGGLSAREQEQIALVVLTVGNADADPRLPVITVAAGTSVAADGPWIPHEMPYPELATLGDPVADPALAGMWRTQSEFYDAGLIDWALPASALGDWRADDRSSPNRARRMAMGALVGTAGKLRTRLRRRAHLNDQMVLLALTDRLEQDNCMLVTEQMNPLPIPFGAAAFLNGGQPPFADGRYGRADVIEYARAVAAGIVAGSIDALDGANRLMFLDQCGPLVEQDQPFVKRYWELAHIALNIEHETLFPNADDRRRQIDGDIVEHSRTVVARWR